MLEFGFEETTESEKKRETDCLKLKPEMRTDKKRIYYFLSGGILYFGHGFVSLFITGFIILDIQVGFR